MNIDKWLQLNSYNIKGTTIAITGSTGGLGEIVSMYLAGLNANLVFLNRNIKKSVALEEKIKSIYPNTNIDHVEMDLSDINSVKNAIFDLKRMSIDILILNAGVYNVPIFKTNSGYNNIFQTNFLSQYYLVKELLPILEKSKFGKVVAVGSVAHNYSSLDESDIDFSTRKKQSIVYGNSKRFLIFALHELLKDHKVSLSIVHPGITLTNMTNHYPKAINWLVKIGIKLLFPNPKSASLSIIKGIFDSTPYHTWIGPSAFNIWGKLKKKKLQTCSTEESKKIYKLAEDIYKKIN